MKTIRLLILLGIIVIVLGIAVQQCATYYVPLYIAEKIRLNETVDVAFDYFECNIFIPTFTFRKVHIQKSDEETEIDCTIGRVCIESSWLSIIARGYVVKKLTIDASEYTVTRPFIRPQRPEESWQHNLFPKIKDIFTITAGNYGSRGIAYASSDTTGPLVSGIGTLPLSIDKTFIHNGIFRLRHIFPEDNATTVTTFEYDATVENFKYPEIDPNQPVDVSLTAIVRATEEGNAWLTMSINSITPAINGSFTLRAQDIYIPHFNKYFSKSRYDIQSGDLAIVSDGRCENDDFVSNNTVTLSQCVVAYGDNGIVSASPEAIPQNIFEISNKTLTWMVNSVAEDAVTFDFVVAGNLVAQEFLVKDAIKDAFLSAMKRKLTKELINQRGLFEGVVKALFELPGDAQDKIRDGGEAIDDSVHKNVGRAVDLFRALLEDKR